MDWGSWFGPAAGLAQDALDPKNPADSAMQYYDRIAGDTKPYYQPYMDAGNKSLSGLQDQYSSLIQDPSAFMNRVGSGYKQSPGYQWKLNQGMQAGNNAAAAGGMLGSPQHQQQATAMATGFADQDYYDYLDHALNLYGKGMEGSSHINDLGYGANTGYADNLASTLMSQGNLRYTGQANENQQKGALFGSMLGMGGSMMMHK